MTHLLPDPTRLPRRWTSVRLAAALLLAAAGCATPWEKSALLKDDLAEIDSVQGPTERRLRGLMREKKQQASVDSNGELKPIAGTDEYLAAQKLYDAKKYAEAEKTYKKIAKKFKKSEIREDALFMQAESEFAQDKLAAAHDRYSEILTAYPTTRHLDVIMQRLFKISMIWLDHPQVAELSEIQQVDYDRPGERLPPQEMKPPPPRQLLVPNFTDKTRPLFDTQGNALAALKSIWTNDPTGPLADDALMLAASYYARTGDFIEADRHFTLLREQFPNSPHVQKAFELGAHVKLMSYEGSIYDDKALQDSELLKEATLRLYPELDHRDRVESELQKIEQAKADRLWALVLFYEGKRQKKSAAIYCHMLITEYPKSPHAEAAQKRLEQYGPAYADGRALRNPYPDPPKTLMTAIFPPDDHGGEPVIPPPPGAKPEQPIYGARFALFKEQKNQSSAPAKPQSKPQQPKYGAKFALFKPQKEPPAAKPSPETPKPTKPPVATGPKKPATPPPRQLPDEDDPAAKPAPSGRARLNATPPARTSDDDGDGHTSP